MKKILISLLLIGIITGSCKKDPLSPGGSNGKNVGTSAHDLLSSDKYKSMKIEIQYMEGFQPNQASVDNLRNFIGSVVNKPSGVTVVMTQIPASGKSSLTLSEIREIEKEYRTVYNEDNQIGVYFLFTDGAFSQNNVLGVAYQNTSMALFGETIHSNSGGFLQPSREKLETTVLNHEFGHILGLVDIGSPMVTDHKDDPNGAHCTVQTCLMYYQVETTDVLNNLMNGAVPGLDSQCMNDLRANGGK